MQRQAPEAMLVLAAARSHADGFVSGKVSHKLCSASGVFNRAMSAGEGLGVDPLPWVARTLSLRPILLLAGRDSRAIHPNQPRLYGPEMGKAGRMGRLWPRPDAVRALELFKQTAGAIHRSTGEFKLAPSLFLPLTALTSSVPTESSHTARAARLGQLGAPFHHARRGQTRSDLLSAATADLQHLPQIVGRKSPVWQETYSAIGHRHVNARAVVHK